MLLRNTRPPPTSPHTRYPRGAAATGAEMSSMHVAASRAGIYIMQLGAVSPHTRYRFPVERVRWKHIRAPPPRRRGSARYVHHTYLLTLLTPSNGSTATRRRHHRCAYSGPVPWRSRLPFLRCQPMHSHSHGMYMHTCGDKISIVRMGQQPANWLTSASADVSPPKQPTPHPRRCASHVAFHIPRPRCLFLFAGAETSTGQPCSTYRTVTLCIE